MLRALATTLALALPAHSLSAAAGPGAEAPPEAHSPLGDRLLGDWPAAFSGKRISLVGKVRVDEALEKVADAGGFSLVADTGQVGEERVLLHLKSVPVETALEALLEAGGLTAVRRGDTVHVAPAAATSGPPPAPGGRSRPSSRGGGEPPRAGEGAARAAGSRAPAKAPDRVRAGDITVAPGERVGDVVALRGSVRLAPGSSARQATAILGSVEVEPGATVDEDVVAIAGEVHVFPGAHVAGDVVSIGGEVVADPGAALDGDDVSVSIPGLHHLAGFVGSRPHGPSAEISPLLWALRVLAKFAVFFALALLVLVFAPGRLEVVASGLARRPLQVLLAGLLGTVALPVIALLLVVTIVGIPLVAVQAVVVLVAAVLGYSALALFLGRAAPLRAGKAAAVRQLALGTALVVAVSEIPVVGWLAMVSAWLVVFGSVLRTRFGQAQAAPTPGPP